MAGIARLTEAVMPGFDAATAEEGRRAVAAMIAERGDALRALTARRTHYVPGRGVTVVFRAVVVPAGGSATVDDTYVLAVQAPPTRAPAGLEVWRVPDDPALPGLRVALDRAGASDLVGDEVSTATMVAYRPRRRAVVRLDGPRSCSFVKVVRPEAAPALRGLHEAFAASRVPAPRVVGSSDEVGLVALDALPGRSLVDVIAEGSTADLPGAGDLLRLSASIGEVTVLAPRRGGVRADARHHAELVRAVVPAEGQRLDRLVAEIGAEPPRPPLATIHGDLYAAHVLVDQGRVCGVLDIDRAGPGEPADDLANLLGHLEALALHRPAMARATAEYLRTLLPSFEAAAGRDDLRRRVAAVLVALATGPFRMMRPRWQIETTRYLDRAEAWLP